MYFLYLINYDYDDNASVYECQCNLNERIVLM